MVDVIRDVPGSGPTGQFTRPGGARFEPGEGTRKIIPNRHAQVTVDVGPPMVPIGSVAGRRMAEHLMTAQAAPGEVIVGVNLLFTQPRTNDEWLRGRTIPSYDGPLQLAGNPTFGRGEADSHANADVPRWFPTYPQDIPVEDRSG